jgi:type III secretory pathway lipoprotein EscJ
MEKGWELVYSTGQEYKANIARELLENESIKVVVLNQHDSAYQLFGDFSLYVAETDVARAVELLKNLKN